MSIFSWVNLLINDISSTGNNFSCAIKLTAYPANLSALILSNLSTLVLFFGWIFMLDDNNYSITKLLCIFVLGFLIKETFEFRIEFDWKLTVFKLFAILHAFWIFESILTLSFILWFTEDLTWTIDLELKDAL